MMKNKYQTAMYQRGYDNAAIRFAYIPDFKTSKEKQDFEAGFKAGVKSAEGTEMK